MRRSVHYWLATLFALAALTVQGWSGLLTAAFNDWEDEAETAAQALERGDWGQFFEQVPAYGPSLLLRAPVLLIRGLFEDGPDGLYRAFALPGLIAFGLLGMVLFTIMMRSGRPRGAWLALVLCVASPLVTSTLSYGHPEELIGGALVAGGAIAAARDRTLLTGVLLGFALIIKAWAGLAILPLLIILRRKRLYALCTAGAIAFCGWLPFFIWGNGSANAVTRVVDVGQNAGPIFHPTSIWWFFASHQGPVFSPSGEKFGYRTPPEWVTVITHPLMLLVPILLGLLLIWLRRKRGGPTIDEGLLLLALTFMLRCELDTWNRSYYAIPFLAVLLIWEIHARGGLPWITALATALVTLTTITSLPRVTPDVNSVLYVAWVLPATALLIAGLFFPQRLSRYGQRVSATIERQLPHLVRLATSR